VPRRDREHARDGNDDLLSQVVMEPMLAGVATRQHARVNEPVGDDLDAQSTSTSRSSVSRRFKAATDAQLDELPSRDLSELDLAALLLDGVHLADAGCVVALAIGADGTKMPVGRWLGDTENKTVVTALLAEIVARGRNTDGGLLAVIDGANALATAARKVFGDTAFIQRCTLHKRRNVRDHPRRTNKRGSIAGSPPRSTTTIPRGVNVPVGTSPRSSRCVGPMRRRACAKASRTCSPSGGWVSAAGSPRASRTRTAPRACSRSRATRPGTCSGGATAR
jgi:hypothetical protein